MTRRLLTVGTAAAIALGFCANAGAQVTQSRFEVGGGAIAGIGLVSYERRSNVSTGIDGRVDVNLTRRLAVEARVGWFPQQASILYEAQGGRTAQVAIGARARFVDTRHFSLYGVLLPGALHFTDSSIGISNETDPQTGHVVRVIGGKLGPTTHFALTMGGGVEVSPTPRMVAHVEWTGLLYAFPSLSSDPSPPGPNGGRLVIILPGGVTGLGEYDVGVSYRLGRARPILPETGLDSRWEAGTEVNYTSFLNWSGDVLRRELGVSGFASYRLGEYVYADAGIGGLPQNAPSSPFDGGRMLEGLAGVKLGLRRNHVGLFAKTRAGVRRHSAVVTSFLTTPPFTATRGSLNVPAVDVGAIVEVYLPRSLMIRVDAGDTTSLPRTAHFTQDGLPSTAHASSSDAIEMAVGMGWQF